MAEAEEESMLLILGNNVFPQTMNAEDSEKVTAEQQLQIQIDWGEYFRGQTVFIPGNRNWDDFKALIKEEEFITKNLGDQAFFPKNGCALESMSLNDSLALIFVNSQWYLENWDRTKEINRECKIKTREEFFEDFENLLGLNQNKTIVIAQHHPLVTHGNHGG